jgi:hypothetical protein
MRQIEAGVWLFQVDDLRTLLGEFVSSLPQVELFGVESVAG